jgi:uncharacterized cofD-like protein
MKSRLKEGFGPKIVVIGGGTGSFTLLSALKYYTRQLTALVNMADDGGSTGELRDELGVLPPGDVRQCLVALSDSPKVRELFNYRFEEGRLKGHAFGNLFLTALEKLNGNFAEAIETASEVLRVEGEVLPATLDNVRLKMSWPDKQITLSGERVIDADNFAHDPREAKLELVPSAKPNPEAIEAIEKADIVVIAPGDLYTSLGPVLIADGYEAALKKTKGKVVYVCNLVTKLGQTSGFTVTDHAAEIERFIGSPVLDVVLYNDAKPDKKLLARYAKDGEYGVEFDKKELKAQHYKAKGGKFLANGTNFSIKKGDPLAKHRTFIRHDADKVARALMKIYFS